MTPHAPRPGPVEAETGPAPSGADIVQRLRDKNRGWHPDQIDAADAIEALRDQVAALEQDAARYRWLRDVARTVDWSEYISKTAYRHNCRIGGAGMDAAIDAAMKA